MDLTTEEMSQSNELGYKTRAWTLYDFVWRGVLDHLALVDDRQHISETQRFFLIVGHQDGGDASLHENGLHFFAQLLPEMLVEVAKRFIEEEQLRCWGQSAGEGHALLLTSRELVGIALSHAF